MPEYRTDVEQLFMVDRIPPGVAPIYDALDNRGTKRVPLIQLEGGTKATLVEELRSDVVRSIVGVRRKTPPLSPFTLVRAHEAMANRDVMLAAFLCNPTFTPLCEKLLRPLFGIVAQLFAHYEVPSAEIYAVCEPRYLGVIPIQNGHPGAYRFSENVVWGRFHPRAGV